MNFVKFLRTPFLREHLRWLLLKFVLHFKFRSLHVEVTIRTAIQNTHSESIGKIVVQVYYSVVLRKTNISIQKRIQNPAKHVEWTEAVVQRCSVEKMFLEISQNPQEKDLC